MKVFDATPVSIHYADEEEEEGEGEEEEGGGGGDCVKSVWQHPGTTFRADNVVVTRTLRPMERKGSTHMRTPFWQSTASVC